MNANNPAWTKGYSDARKGIKSNPYTSEQDRKAYRAGQMAWNF